MSRMLLFGSARASKLEVCIFVEGTKHLFYVRAVNSICESVPFTSRRMLCFMPIRNLLFVISLVLRRRFDMKRCNAYRQKSWLIIALLLLIPILFAESMQTVNAEAASQDQQQRCIDGLYSLLGKCKFTEEREVILQRYFFLFPDQQPLLEKQLRDQYPQEYNQLQTQEKKDFCGTSQVILFLNYLDQIPQEQATAIKSAMEASMTDLDQQIVTDHFRLHYTSDPASSDYLAPDAVVALSNAAESAWTRQVTEWGYHGATTLLSDKMEVYIRYDPAGSHFWPITGDIVINPSDITPFDPSDPSPLLVVVAHEFHHASQNTYLWLNALTHVPWIIEGSARWMQHECMRAEYPTGEPIGMYDMAVSAEWERTMYSTLLNSEQDMKTKDVTATGGGYASVFFWYFLADNLFYDFSGSGDRRAINRYVWEELQASPLGWLDADNAIGRALSHGPAGHNTFASVFANCAKAYSVPHNNIIPGLDWFNEDIDYLLRREGCWSCWVPRVFRSSITAFPFTASTNQEPPRPVVPLNGVSFAPFVFIGDRRENYKISVDGDDGKAFFAYVMVCGDGQPTNNSYLDPEDNSSGEHQLVLSKPANIASLDNLTLDPETGQTALIVVIGKTDDGDANYTVTIDKSQRQPPTASILSILPNPATQVLDTITFTGSGDDPDTQGAAPEIRTYRWILGNAELYAGPNSLYSVAASSLPAGTHDVSLYVQDNDGEWSEAAVASLTVLPPQSGQVDYRVNQLSMVGETSGLQGGGPTALTVETANIGPAAGGSSSVTRFFLSTLPYGDPRGSGVVVATRNVSSLVGGGSQSESFSTQYPAVADGVYYLAACVDADNQIGETNETNNWTYFPTALTFGDGTPPVFGVLTLNSPSPGSNSPIKTGDPIFVDLSWDFAAASNFPDADGVAFHFRFQQGGYSWSTTWRPYKTKTGRNTFRIASSTSAIDGNYSLEIEVENLSNGAVVLAKTWPNTVNLSPSHGGVTLPRPAAPTASLIWAGRNNVHLEWDYGAYGQTEFRYERSVNGGPFGRVHWLDCHGQAVKVDDETVQPGTVQPGTIYAYRFQARIGDTIVSEFSDSVSILVPLPCEIPPGALVYPDSFSGLSIAQALGSAKIQGRSEVYIRPGEYTQTVGFPGGITLIGCPGSTTLRGNVKMGLISGEPMGLSGITLVGPGSLPDGIGLELYHVGDVTLEDVVVRGFSTGIDVNASSLLANGLEISGASSRSLHIHNDGCSVNLKSAHIHDNTGVGILFDQSNSSLSVRDSKVTNNGGHGVQAVFNQGSCEFNRTVFSRNSGYGFYGQTTGGSVVVKNCIAYSNTMAGLAAGGGVCRNCISISNGGEGILNGPYYCLAYGNAGGNIFPSEYENQVGNNIVADPRCVSPSTGDFHLLSDSPAIDTGDPADPYDLEPEPNGNHVNMGNYGNTPGATTSLGVPPARPNSVLVDALPGVALRVRWWDASDNELGFRVERKKEGDSVFSVIRELLSDDPLTSGTMEITDEGLLPEMRYWYRTCSFNSHGTAVSDAASTPTYQAPVGNRPPDTPRNVFPFFAQDSVSSTTFLLGSAFSDPDAGDALLRSQFQVTTISGSYSLPVWDSGDITAGKNYSAVPSSANLQLGQSYRWRCRYQDDKGAWSAWSNETSFTVIAAPTIPSVWLLR